MDEDSRHESQYKHNSPEHKVQCRLLLDVVVAESTAILELLAGENQPLLIRRDAGQASQLRQRQVDTNRTDVPLLVLDLGFNIVDGVGRLHLKGDRLPREGLDEDLHLGTVNVEYSELGWDTYSSLSKCDGGSRSLGIGCTGPTRWLTLGQVDWSPPRDSRSDISRRVVSASHAT